MLKKIIGKLERKMIMTWMLMWLNWSGATINVMLQLLDILAYNPHNVRDTYYKRQIVGENINIL